MKNITLMKKIAELRRRKGFSQELLAEHSGLNLRTIQRIEKGETIPRGDTLRKLALAFDVSPEEFSDWTLEENKGYLLSLNISALTSLVFPVLGILFPMVMWFQKKDKIQGVKDLGRKVLNFQFTLTLLLFVSFVSEVIVLTNTFEAVPDSNEINSNLIVAGIKNSLRFFLMTLVLLNVFNICYILFNTLRLSRGKNARYPSIPFIKG